MSKIRPPGAPPGGEAVTVTTARGRFEASFAYDPALVAAVKAAGWRWDGEARVWWTTSSPKARALADGKIKPPPRAVADPAERRCLFRGATPIPRDDTPEDAAGFDWCRVHMIDCRVFFGGLLPPCRSCVEAAAQSATPDNTSHPG